jgi:hypothetical protein
MKLLANKLLPFLILLFVVLGCTKLGRQPTARYEQQKEVVKILNEKFDLSNSLQFNSKGKRIEYDCQFKFELGVEDGKITLIVYFCESTSSAMKERKLADVLTPENTTLIKGAGFEQVKLYERITYKLVDTVTIQSAE